MELNKQEKEGQEEPPMQEAMANSSSEQTLVASPKKQKLCESELSNTGSRPDCKSARHAVFWSAFARKKTPRSNPASKTTGTSGDRFEPSLPMEDSVLETQQERIYEEDGKKYEAKKAELASCLSITYKGEHTCEPSENTDKNLPLITGVQSLNEAFMQLKENLPLKAVWRECPSSASSSTSANFEEGPISTTPVIALETFNQLAKPDTQPSLFQKNRLPAASACTSSSTLGESSIKPSSNAKGPCRIQVSLTLENIRQEKILLVGALFYPNSSETLEFCFFSALDMAACVGVGLPHAKVILHNDLSITIQELFENEWELENIISSVETHHLVMKVKGDETRTRQNGVVHVPRSVMEEGEAFSRLLGVGFKGGCQYVEETYDRREVSWPLLYDIALFILTNTNDLQCNTYTFGTSSAEGNLRDNMVHTLHGKHDFLQKHGNLKERRGGGDEDGFAHNLLEEEDDPPTILKVTVHPRSKCDILDTHVNPYGLDCVSIAPILVFEFHQNRESKRIFIKAITRLELASQSDVLSNIDLFGWYHTGIQISFGCEDAQGHPQSGRVALLRQSSCNILNPIVTTRYIVANSRLSSTVNSFCLGGQATAKSHAALLGGIELQGSSSVSRMKEEGTSKCENVEVVLESVCKGFSFRDSSSTEFPARANFFLTYPLENFNIWDNREFLQNQGLFSSIEPCIEGCWIPLNGLDASPYLFKVIRSLKLHTRGDKWKEHVIEHKQEYVLPFYVNHAMTHLRSQKSKDIELNGDRASVPNVLQVGSVY